MLSASRSGSPVRRAVPAMGQVSTRLPSTRTNISGDAPIKLLVAELQTKLVRAGAGVLDPLEQLRRAAANNWPEKVCRSTTS